MSEQAPSSAPPRPAAFPEDWTWHHARAATALADIEGLFPGRFDLGGLDGDGIARAAALYGMRATPYYLDLARAADPADPIWALAVPSPAELVRTPEERDDPIGDEVDAHRPLAALTHRYPDRVLLYPTPTCSVHCRHCFRKRLVGKAEHAVSEAQIDEAVDYVAAHPGVHEVILTGGDPLTLSDGRLLALLGRLDAVEHVWSLRLHTRMPVVNPYRLTDDLARGLGRLSTRTRLVTHFNHPREVTSTAAAGMGRLRTAGIDVLNQAVLLAGLNDDVEVHRELIWGLVRAGVRPYALHHADLVPGTAHLRTTLETGCALMRGLRGTVPGHALPVYLLDVPGGHGKVPVDYPWVSPGVLGGRRIEAPDGSFHLYGGPAVKD